MFIPDRESSEHAPRQVEPTFMPIKATFGYEEDSPVADCMLDFTPDDPYAAGLMFNAGGDEPVRWIFAFSMLEAAARGSREYVTELSDINFWLDETSGHDDIIVGDISKSSEQHGIEQLRFLLPRRTVEFFVLLAQDSMRRSPKTEDEIMREFADFAIAQSLEQGY